MNYKNWHNPKRSPIAEVTFELPHGEFDGKLGYFDLTPNPVITVVYEDGNKVVYDTNLIFKRGYEAGAKDTNDAIKYKLGLK
jgi:hypothetical protein